jgi:hypothetical protein
MSVILIIASLVFGGFLYQPSAFDSGPYTSTNEYTSLAECQIDTLGTKDICVGDNPVTKYVLDKDAYQENQGSTLNYVQCDYWAGCYIKE